MEIISKTVEAFFIVLPYFGALILLTILSAIIVIPLMYLFIMGINYLGDRFGKYDKFEDF